MQVMGGSADVRPLLSTLKKLDSNDLPTAWQFHKEKLRSQFSKHQDAAKAELAQVNASSSLFNGVASILGKLVGRGVQTSADSNAKMMASSPNVIDIIENAARTERVNFLKEQKATKSKMASLRADHEAKILEHLAENKKKNLKLIDYLMGAGGMQPAEAPQQ